MKLHYYPETDSRYIALKSEPGAATRQIAEGLVVDFDAKGDVSDYAITYYGDTGYYGDSALNSSRRVCSARPF